MLLYVNTLEAKRDGCAEQHVLWFPNDCNDVSAIGPESLETGYVGFFFGCVSADDLVVPKDDPLFGVARQQLRKLRSEPCGLGEDTLTDGQDIVPKFGRLSLLRHLRKLAQGSDLAGVSRF